MLDVMGHLTPAERRYLPLMALPIDIAAHRLNRSVSAIKLYSVSIARKLGAGNRSGAIVIAARAGVDLEVMPANGGAE